MLLHMSQMGLSNTNLLCIILVIPECKETETTQFLVLKENLLLHEFLIMVLL